MIICYSLRVWGISCNSNSQRDCFLRNTEYFLSDATSVIEFRNSDRVFLPLAEQQFEIPLPYPEKCISNFQINQFPYFLLYITLGSQFPTN